MIIGSLETLVVKMLVILLVTALFPVLNAKNPLNVLFLASDDMRPELGAYLGPDFPTSVHPNMKTPNLDKLASQSLLLKRAYVQQVCALIKIIIMFELICN